MRQLLVVQITHSLFETFEFVSVYPSRSVVLQTYHLLYLSIVPRMYASEPHVIDSTWITMVLACPAALWRG